MSSHAGKIEKDKNSVAESEARDAEKPGFI